MLFACVFCSLGRQEKQLLLVIYNGGQATVGWAGVDRLTYTNMYIWPVWLSKLKDRKALISTDREVV